MIERRVRAYLNDEPARRRDRNRRLRDATSAPRSGRRWTEKTLLEHDLSGRPTRRQLEEMQHQLHTAAVQPHHPVLPRLRRTG